MKHLFIFHATILGLFFVLETTSLADQSKLFDLNLIVNELGFPKDLIVIKDKTEYEKKSKIAPYLTEELSGKQKATFAAIQVAVAKAHSYLTDKYIKEADEFLAKFKGDPSQGKGLKKIQFDNGAWGYFGLRGFGPGGYQIAFTMTIPSKDVDMLMTLSVRSDEGELIPVPGGEKYTSFMTAQADSGPALTAIAKNSVQRIETMDFPKTTPAISTVHNQSDNGAKPSIPKTDSISATELHRTNETHSASLDRKYSYLLGLLLLFAISVLLWWLRHRIKP